KFDSEIVESRTQFGSFLLEFLPQEPSFQKNPPQRTSVSELELLAQPCSKKRSRPCNSQTKRTGNDSNTLLKITLQSPTPMVPRIDPSAMEVPESSYSSQMV
ncbi:hypothetical protein TNCV_4636081, partial [Trichonephila clavipes]